VGPSGVEGQVNRMIALAINADPRWFWHGPDARHSGPRSSPDPPDRP